MSVADLWWPSCHNIPNSSARSGFLHVPNISTTWIFYWIKKIFSKIKSCSCWVTKRFERFKGGLIWSKVDISIVIGFAIWHLYRTKNNCLNLILASHWTEQTWTNQVWTHSEVSCLKNKMQYFSLQLSNWTQTSPSRAPVRANKTKSMIYIDRIPTNM